MILHVLHFRMNAELVSGPKNDGLEQVAVGTAFEFGHGLRQLSVSPRGVDDLRALTEEPRRGGSPIADAAECRSSEGRFDLSACSEERHLKITFSFTVTDL